MDIDSPPSASFPELDPTTPHKHLSLPSLSASFPLPFRVLFLIGLAQLLWAINLHVLHLLGLDTSWILDLREVDPDGDPIGMHVGPGRGEAGEGIELDDRNDRLSVASNGGSGGDLAREPDTPIRPASGRVIRPQSGKLHGPLYKLFLLYCTFVGSGWVAFRFLSGEEPDAMEKWRIIPGLLAVGVVAGVAVPWRGVAERERAGFRRAVKRIMVPHLNDPIYFSDVILADILTSFAKVLGDLWISTMQIWGGGITQGRVSQRGWANWVTLLMVSLPYMLRFRQCLIEYYQSSWNAPRPLANALKYFSAFPVIFLSAAQKSVVTDIALAKGITVQELGEHHDRWFGEHRLFRLWLLAVCVNSMYSFYWDVEMDWGLALCEVDTWLGAKAGKKDGSGLLGSPGGRPGGRRGGAGGQDVGLLERLKRLITRPTTVNHQRSPCPTPGPFTSPPLPSGSPTRTPLRPGSPPTASTAPRSLLSFGLRQTLLLPDPLVYHLFTIIDLVLRFTWSLKLSSHLHTISEIESGVFMMEALELMRRWMWVFVRVEWEAVKMGEVARFGRAGGGNVVWEEDKEDQ
ncbi:hypothetical protein IAT38_005413 [Cryptococcus sp. DSM 104549]